MNLLADGLASKVMTAVTAAWKAPPTRYINTRIADPAGDALAVYDSGISVSLEEIEYKIIIEAALRICSFAEFSRAVMGAVVASPSSYNATTIEAEFEVFYPGADAAGNRHHLFSDLIFRQSIDDCEGD